MRRSMIILINAINIREGGGKQVTDSICHTLELFREHHFIVVLSSFIRDVADEKLRGFPNVELFEHNVSNRFSTLVLGRDRFMDKLVVLHQVDAVLTVFGPSRWIPRVTHLSGFARAQLLSLDSPYYGQRSLKERLYNAVVKWSFRRCADNYWTENELVSEGLRTLFPKKRVFTVSNTYNQVFARPEREAAFPLEAFAGVTVLILSDVSDYKNLAITVPVSRYLADKYPDFRFRFVISVQREAFGRIPEGLEEHFVFIGKVGIAALPSLYAQADILFQPSLLECFPATYPEAMKMRVPILTTDLDFAHSICGDAAVYYSCQDPADAAEKLYRLATDPAQKASLLSASDQRCTRFMTAEQRAGKLLEILVSLKEGSGRPGSTRASTPPHQI